MNYLKELRIKNNYSQQYMANLLKISKTFYCQIEKRQRRLSYQMAINISKIFDMKPDELFYNDFNKN